MWGQERFLTAALGRAVATGSSARRHCSGAVKVVAAKTASPSWRVAVRRTGPLTSRTTAMRISRTASEAGAEIGRWLPGLLPGLRAAARTFDDVRYGGRPADASTYAALAALEDEARTTRPVEAGAGSAAGTAAAGAP